MMSQSPSPGECISLLTPPPVTISHNDSAARPDLSSYPYRSISSLVPGPARVRSIGTVVNIFSYNTESSAPKAAKGCMKLLLTDGLGEILVKLWYSDVDYTSTILLGTRITVSMTHVSATTTPGMTASMLRALPASITTSVFPERDAGCSVDIDQVVGSKKDISVPLITNSNGLMDLEAFINGAAEDKTGDEIKLLVCAVDVGRVETVKTRTCSSFQILPLKILDKSTTTTTTAYQNRLKYTALVPALVELSLSTSFLPSTSSFIPAQTILLITSPKLQSQARRKIKLTARSQIIINPTLLPESTNLIRWMRNLYSSYIPSPSDLQVYSRSIENADDEQKTKRKARFTPGRGLSWDQGERIKRQYTISLFLSQIELTPHKPFKAYVSVIITSLNLLDLFQSNSLFHGVCPNQNCAAEIQSNNPFSRCDRCKNEARREAIDTDVHAETDMDVDKYANDIANDADTSTSTTITITTNKVELLFTPTLLSGLSDETNGLFLPTSSSPAQTHNIILSDHAVKNLTGLTKRDCALHHDNKPGSSRPPTWDGDISSSSSSSSLPSTTDQETHLQLRVQELEDRFRYIEGVVRWSRVTLVLGWTGETTRDEAEDESKGASSSRDGRIVLLDVLS